MWQGTLESIFIAPGAKAPTQAVTEVRAVPGTGLEGDRYALRTGTFFKELPDRELTLIEAEAIEAIRREYNVEMTQGQARRNLVTRDAPLNHLVGKEFWVGDVRIRGIRLCEPCSHLESVTRLPVIKTLTHRGGLRAQILSAGVVRVGDIIRE